jgi:hypothetical protein
LTGWTTSARACSGFGTNIGAAFSGKAKAAARIVAVRAEKSFFIISLLADWGLLLRTLLSEI